MNIKTKCFSCIDFFCKLKKIKIPKCAAVFDYIESQQFVQENSLGVGAKRTRGQQKCFSDQSAMNEHLAKTGREKRFFSFRVVLKNSLLSK